MAIISVFDIETSGFNRSYDHILEWAVIRCDEDFNVLQSNYGYLWRPGWDVGATDIHGLTADFMKRKCTDFNQSLAQLYALLYNSNVVGKNNSSFDNPFVMTFMLQNLGFGVEPFKFRKKFDIQPLMSKFYRQDYLEKNGTTTKDFGKLGDYIRLIDSTEKDMKDFYKTLNHDSERSDLHSAMYDTAITFKCLEWLRKEQKMDINFV